MNIFRITGWMAAACFAVAVGARALGAEAQFMLPEAATTSAGIFDADGRLVKTLWRGVRYEAGTYPIRWDGKDDDGKPVSGGPVKARVIYHNVRYVWEGVIGNTSRSFTGGTVHRSFLPINEMAIDDAGNAFYVVGYNEQQNGLHRFSTKDPQTKTALARDDYRRSFRHVATDGVLAYFANGGTMAPRGSFLREPTTFVIALNVSDNKEYKFPAGAADFHEQPGRNAWASVIDRDKEDQDVEGNYRSGPTGLAVQKKGDLLFVAHGYLNEVRIFHKREGKRLGQFKVASPTALAIAPDDNLWVLCKSGDGWAVVLYKNLPGNPTATTTASEGLVRPVSIGCSPLDGTVLVADPGTEQIRAFDAAGQPAWTLGAAGGQPKNGPAATFDKFWLSEAVTYVTCQADGSFWLGDGGNRRNLHFSKDRKYIEMIMYSPHSYVCAVDPANPSRVFNRFMEFKVDYAKPLAQSWTFVANWAAGLDGKYFGFADGLKDVFTLSNGRTYGVLQRFGGGDTKEIVELAAGGLRPTGATMGLGVRLYADGSQRYHEIKNQTLTVFQKRLTGFDGAGNLQWGAPEVIASARAQERQDPFYHNVPTVWACNESCYPITASDVVISFNPGKGEGFHLGGIKKGAKDWLWRASPSAPFKLDKQGNIIDADGSYELGRNVNYPGNIVTVAGRNVIYGYHGEMWNGGQADQWMHFYDNGLFVGQFGQPNYPMNNRVEAWPGAAGNAFAPHLVTVGGQVYLWHNDESVHAGVHRWKIEGWNTLREIEVPIGSGR